jgi:hypothetical protein
VTLLQIIDVICCGKLIGQINDVLSFFGTLDSVTKSELLYRFCGSICGSVLWDLSNPAINRICSAWRFALKQIWKLPVNTHNYVVNALNDKIPIFD